MKFARGEAIGLTWEVHNRELKILERRTIVYEENQTKEYEYKLCAINNPRYTTEWIKETQLFSLKP